jgi:nitrogen regulatory protein P-II 1
MSMLKAILVVRPHRADVLCQRFMAQDWIEELSAVECRGYGRQKGHLDNYQGSEYSINFLPKVLITAQIPATQKQAFIDLVLSLCRTGRIGDGKIFFIPIEQAVQIA